MSYSFENMSPQEIYAKLANTTSIDYFIRKYNIPDYETALGIIEMCNLNGFELETYMKDDIMYIAKPKMTRLNVTPPSLDDPTVTNLKIMVIADTHYGNKGQQWHLVREAYLDAQEWGADVIFHLGDLHDGLYPDRKETPRQQIFRGFDQQVLFTRLAHPRVERLYKRTDPLKITSPAIRNLKLSDKYIPTIAILGSHDETSYKNGMATADVWLTETRGEDMTFIGQDSGIVTINGVKFLLDHPGGGKAKAVSYSIQKRMEEADNTDIAAVLTGHYHTIWFGISPKGTYGFCVGSMCDRTQFQNKKILKNDVGYLKLDLWTKDGKIIAQTPEMVYYDQNDMWDESRGVGKQKCLKLMRDDGVDMKKMRDICGYY
ncbi:MAG: metallophosphoesterase family protein [Bacilli bacterium]|nr:metallophosphoesterase family protein [Bacilli bacterium]